MRLIVGVDGTPEGMQALEEAIANARDGNHELTIAIFGDQDNSTVEHRVTDVLNTRSFEANIEVIENDAASTLVELAECEEFDQILLPGCRRSPLGKIKLDSMMEFVLLNAETSITLIR